MLHGLFLIDYLTEEYQSPITERLALSPLIGALDVLLSAVPSDNSDAIAVLDAFVLRDALVANV